MALAFVLDEHLRGPLWQAVLKHNLGGENVIDAVRVGDSMEVPLGIDDPDLLAWAEREDRILVTEDRHTMITHLQSHLANGNHSPGVLVVRPYQRVRDVLDCLVLIAEAGEPTDFADLITYIP